jgi:hypothetical protein
MAIIENIARHLDKGTIVFERSFPVTTDVLWATIATQEGLKHWFMPTKYKVKPGGRFSFEGGWDGVITASDPHQLIQFKPNGSDEAYLRFEISKAEAGCVFRLVDKLDPSQDVAEIFSDVPPYMAYQPGGPGTHWSGILAGYHGFVDALEGHLTGDGPDNHFEDLCGVYMTTLKDWYGVT